MRDERTLSQFLRHMRTLADEAVTDEFLRTMWLSCQPQALWMIVSVLDVLLDQLATAADRIHDNIPKVASLSKNTEIEPWQKCQDYMENQVAELRREFSRIRT